MMDWIVSETDAYALLASFLQRKRGIAPLPEMARRAGGKPWFPDQPQVEFNVSHSGGLSLCALADGSVGADIERIRPRGAGLPRYTLSGQEWDWFCARGCRFWRRERSGTGRAFILPRSPAPAGGARCAKR